MLVIARNPTAHACTPDRVLAPLREARLYTHRTHNRKVTQLRNERNAGFAFPCFYVIPWDPEPLCSPTPCNFTGWFWPSPCPSFISGHPRRSKHRIVSATQFANSAARTAAVAANFHGVTIDRLRQTESKMRSHTIALLVFGIMAVALASPVPGHHHEHHVIHVPYKVHTIHHHHTKKIHVPVHHVEKVGVPIPYPVHHVEKVAVPVPVHHVEKVAVPVPVIHKVHVPVHIPVHEEKLSHGWL